MSFKSLQPTPVSTSISAYAGHVTGPAWLSSVVSRHRMRLLILLLIVALASSCTTQRRSEPASSRAAGPAIAQQLADAYIQRLSPQPAASEKEQIRQEFTGMFFSGFTSPDGSVIGRDAAERGFEAGQEFRRKCNASEVKKTMENYGYVATEAEGTWSVRFEVSCFTPRHASSEAWWLNGFGNTEYVLPKKEEKTDQRMLYRISGFLSPRGQYGHLGGYDHEFYATKVVYIKNGG